MRLGRRLSTWSAGATDLPVATILIFPAVSIFIVGMLVGGFSLARLSPRFVDLGYLGEIRLIATVVAAFLVSLAAQGGVPMTTSNRSTVIWIMAVCALHFVVMLTWIWSVKTDFSIQQLYELAVLIAALIVAYHIFSHQPERVLRMMFVAFWSLAIVFCVLGLVLSGRLSGDLVGLGAGGIGSARLLGVGVIFSLLLFFRTNNVTTLMPVPVFLLGMMLSGSRASILALAFSVVLLWAYRNRLATSGGVDGRRAVVILLLFSVGMIAMIVTIPSSREALIRFALSNITASGNDASSSAIYLADRDTIFLTAWESFLSNALSGGGIGTYVGPFGELYPHNLVLNFAVDGGIPGLAGVVVLLAWPVARIISTNNAWAIGALSAGLFFLIASLFSGTYYDARFIWIFFLLGLLCADKGAEVVPLGDKEVFRQYGGPL